MVEENLEPFFKSLAKDAGRIMTKYFAQDINTEWKEDLSPLTIADTTINDLVIERINQKYPTHSIQGEERSDLKDSEYLWICDPIDGTMPFSRKIPMSVFSLALTKNGKAIAGVLFDPYLDRLVFAQKGTGTTLNDKKVHSNNISTLDRKTSVAIESWNLAKYDTRPILNEVIERGIVLYSPNSILYYCMLIAIGKMEAAIFPHTTAHDAAAAKVIVEEAGGKFTSIRGEEQKYDGPIDGFIASNGVLHKKLVKMCEVVKIQNAK